MVVKAFICKNKWCQTIFQLTLISYEEAEKNGIALDKPSCPRCGCENIAAM